MIGPRRFLACALLLGACGYVGDPLPPSLHIPRAVPDLRVYQVGSWIELRFTVPSLTTDDVGIERLLAVEAGVGEGDPARLDEWASGARIIAVAKDQPGPAQARAPVQDFAGKTVLVGVRVQSVRGRWSAWPPLVKLTVRAPLAIPSGFRAASDPQGVRLQWAAAGTVRVWKRAAGADGFVEAGLASGGEWLDAGARFGEQAEYQIEAVEEEAASERSIVLKITPEDTFPPAPPRGLAVVAGVGSIELAWERNSESDVAGYQVYRSEGGGPAARMGAMTAAASFSDRDVRAGLRYRYTVTAVDANDNESAPSAAVEQAAP